MSRSAVGALGAEPTPPGRGPARCRSRCSERSSSPSAVGSTACSRATTAPRSSVAARSSPRCVRTSPGDDVRLIDWNVTARTSEPHIRVHLAERVLVTWIVLDTSPSMAFGTADRRKADVALGVALALGHAASVRGNRVGVVAFGGPQERVVPPRQGRAGLVGLLLALRDAHEPGAAAGAGLDVALHRLGAAARQRALVVVVSDFRGPRTGDGRCSTSPAATRCSPSRCAIRESRCSTPAGVLGLVDPESGRTLRVDTGDARLRARFAEAAAAERREVARDLASAGARHVVLSTEGDWLRPLAAFLRRRQR